MAHRIREGMRELHPENSGPLGGANKVVEVDESYVGGKARNRKGKVPPKEAMVALVERSGRVRSHHVADVTAKTLRPILKAQLDRRSYVMTDEGTVYPPITGEFAGHGTVNHSIEEYVRGGFWHTNTVESYFSILKRGITGTYHHVSARHLKRYLGEFDFRHNERSALGIDDAKRAKKAVSALPASGLPTDSLTGEPLDKPARPGRPRDDESLGARFSPMNAAFLSWSRFWLCRARLRLMRLRRGVQHALDHLVAAASRLFIAVAIVGLFTHD